jgi:hypothetical protein
MIVGEDDPGTPVAAHEIMHQNIAGSELVMIPNLLHFSNMGKMRSTTPIWSFWESIVKPSQGPFFDKLKIRF